MQSNQAQNLGDFFFVILMCFYQDVFLQTSFSFSHLSRKSVMVTPHTMLGDF